MPLFHAKSCTLLFRSKVVENDIVYEYVVKPQSITWNNAEVAAESAGGKLVSINSQEEYDFITAIVKRYYARTWIGLRRREGTTNIYDWEDGTSVAVEGTGSTANTYFIDDDGNYTANAFANWMGGEPIVVYEGVEENCIEITERGEWNDMREDSDHVFAYIIEYR